MNNVGIIFKQRSKIPCYCAIGTKYSIINFCDRLSPNVPQPITVLF
jgi:hypothetical protein